MGRTMLWPDKIIAALPAGTLERMAAVLGPGETKTDFLRSAVLPALAAREAEAPPDLDAPIVSEAVTVEEPAVPPTRSPVRDLDVPSYWLPKPPSRLDRKRAARLAKVRDTVFQMWKLPPCCGAYCTSRSSLICVETEQALCSDHRWDAVWPVTYAALEAAPCDFRDLLPAFRD